VRSRLWARVVADGGADIGHGTGHGVCGRRLREKGCRCDSRFELSGFSGLVVITGIGRARRSDVEFDPIRPDPGRGEMTPDHVAIVLKTHDPKKLVGT